MLPSRLETTRKTLADASRPLDERGSIALEESAKLDREAQSSPDADSRHDRSADAVRLLDDFNAANPRNPLETPLALQAAVYVWADGRRDLEGWRLTPRDGAKKTRAEERLNEAIRRLEKLDPDLSGADPIVAQNARFRLAQARADRAGIDGDSSTAGREHLRKSLAALEPMPTESAVEGHARLLRADVLARIGDLNRAEEELDATARLKPAPPGPEVAEIRTRILLGQRRYIDAIRAIDGAGLDNVARDALAVDVRLAQRSDTTSASARTEAEADAFRRARTLRGSNRPEARAAMNHLARSLDEPPPHAEPDDWDLLGDAALGLGDAPRASTLVVRGAERARTLGRPEESARLLLRAGAILFQTGDYAGADALLGRAWDVPRPNPVRPKAGLLRALARGRAQADRQPGATRAGYLASLRDLIREYPDDPATPEARWLLGEAEREDGRLAEAIALWKAIPVAHPRWLASRLAIAAENQRELDELRIGDDATAIRSRFREAGAFLRDSTRQATAAPDVAELDLAAARLDLTPNVGRPELARSLCDRIVHQAGSAEDHCAGRGSCGSSRLGDDAADRRGRGGDPRRDGRGIGRRPAARGPADRPRGRRRRIRGQPPPPRPSRPRDHRGPRPRGERPRGARLAKWKLRAVRALVFAGDLEAARRLLRADPALDPAAFDLDDLRDLADAFLRMDAPAMAVEVERLRGRRLKPGSPAWLESRYLLALALYRDRKPGDARSIIDAAAILHPDLGGAHLKPRFERLRQRIDQE